MFTTLNNDLITVEAMIGNLGEVRHLLPEEFYNPIREAMAFGILDYGATFGPVVVYFDETALLHVYYAKHFDGKVFTLHILVARDEVVIKSKCHVKLDWPAAEIDTVLRDTVSKMTIETFARIGIMVNFHFPENWY